MYEKVRVYIEEQHMFEAGDRVIAGVSGGADSICLLFMLLKLREELGIEITAVHVHHGLRGAAADGDEAYVRSVCEKEGVPLRVFHEDVKSYAKEHGMTEEEAGRVLRRRDFEAVLREVRGTKIALAHHMNDNAETVLFHLCRGSALRGLGGIAPVTGYWVRPLLCLGRKEIESYLEKWGISYCTDATNEEDAYTRNRIRSRVIPCLESVNDRAVEHILETSAHMRDLWEYIGGEASRWRSVCTREEADGELLLLEEPYREVPEVLKSYVMHDVLCRACGHSRDIESVHVKQAAELFDRQVGRRLMLPYGISARRDYEGIRFAAGGERQIDAPEGEFHFRVIERVDAAGTFPEKIYTKWFDYDIINNTVKIRHREPGDYITIDRTGNTQKLKQYFINEKIPRAVRDSIWLAADGHHVMWIVGYRQNQSYQVTDATERILEIEFCKGEGNVRDDKSNDR